MTLTQLRKIYLPYNISNSVWKNLFGNCVKLISWWDLYQLTNTSQGCGCSILVAAGEDISAGSTVYIGSDGTVFNADATDPLKPAQGFILTSVTTSNTVTVHLGNGLITGLTGLTPTFNYYQSIVPGEISLNQPTNSGEYVQPVGYAINSTTLYFEPQPLIFLN